SKGIAADATLASDAEGGSIAIASEVGTGSREAIASNKNPMRVTNGSTTITTAKDASGKITAVTTITTIITSRINLDRLTLMRAPTALLTCRRVWLSRRKSSVSCRAEAA
ncbi:MAG: hypothetical protein WCO71_05575, partial [Pseudomonadota bacterium]